MDKFEASIDRAFKRTGQVLDKIEEGEDPQEAVDEIQAAQPWDLVNIGQSFVRDMVQNERDEDERTIGKPPT